MAAAVEQIPFSDWCERIKKAQTQKEVFSILNDFQKLEWTNQERASMAKFYHRVIANLAPGEESVKPATADDTATANDGPVWYEKM